MRRTARLLAILLAAPGCFMTAPATVSEEPVDESPMRQASVPTSSGMDVTATEAPPPEPEPELTKASSHVRREARSDSPANVLNAIPQMPAMPKDGAALDSMSHVRSSGVAIGGAAGGLSTSSLNMELQGRLARGPDPTASPKTLRMREPMADAVSDDGRAIFGDSDEHFANAGVNPLVDASEDKLSTFAIDVDTGSYTLSRRYLENGAMPSAAGVRVEEWVNAFHYSYADESGAHPFSIHMEGAPLAKQSYVVRIGIQGKRIAKQHRDPVHLTFLVDVSGSMRSSDRLPLAKQALGLLVGELGDKDSVSLVTYAGSTSVVLSSTSATSANRGKILDAIASLQNGGGTNMGSGMELAYREANKALGDKGISRVIVLSDGDANIGHTGHAAMLQAIKGYVSEGVTMSTVGFGTGNYRDNLMEQLADAGNGNYSYVGSLKDAKKIFVDDLTGTLQVIAKDTKIQVEMNPAVVAKYRLIGYENRDVADRDFRNDKVDAGEIGAGHTVTALYEVTFKDDEPIGDIATVRVRYKKPKGDRAIEVATVFPASALAHDVDALTADGRFAVGVGLSAEVFRHSAHMDRLGIDLSDAHRLMQSGAVGPYASERKEIVRLIAPLVAGSSVAAR